MCARPRAKKSGRPKAPARHFSLLGSLLESVAHAKASGPGIGANRRAARDRGARARRDLSEAGGRERVARVALVLDLGPVGVDLRRLRQIVGVAERVVHRAEAGRAARGARDEVAVTGVGRRPAGAELVVARAVLEVHNQARARELVDGVRGGTDEGRPAERAVHELLVHGTDDRGAEGRGELQARAHLPSGVPAADALPVLVVLAA